MIWPIEILRKGPSAHLVKKFPYDWVRGGTRYFYPLKTLIPQAQSTIDILILQINGNAIEIK